MCEQCKVGRSVGNALWCLTKADLASLWVARRDAAEGPFQAIVSTFPTAI